jgi:hypothetical protein
VDKLSKEQRNAILERLVAGVEASPVLTHLGLRVRALRGRFYLERSWPDDDVGETYVEVVGRITPLAKPKGRLLLEVEYRKGSWKTHGQGTAAEVMAVVAGDKMGTFHGLGALDESLRRAGAVGRPEVSLGEDGLYRYAQTGQQCSVQEVLYHLFGLPVEVIAEPGEWYARHRTPRIVEVSEEGTEVLVRFSAISTSGRRFFGTCLYVQRDGEWRACTIKPNQAESIATALTWLEKRGFEDW